MNLLDLVLLQQDCYAAAPAGDVYDCAEDRFVLTHDPGELVITIRGTANPLGWWSDFQIAPHYPRAHPQLGLCEQGFLDGAEAIWTVLRPLLGTDPPVKVTLQGHSRGAGIAPIIAGLMVLDRVPPDKVICWEKPWSGGAQLRSLLDKAAIPGFEPWHGDDPVPLVPAVEWLVLNFWPIVHFGKWLLKPFDCHGIAGIVTDVQAGLLVDPVP